MTYEELNAKSLEYFFERLITEFPSTGKKKRKDCESITMNQILEERKQSIDLFFQEGNEFYNHYLELSERM